MKSLLSRKTKQITILIMIVFLFTAGVFSAVNSSSSVQTEANPARWILCRWEEGALAYNVATTDLLPFLLRSQSTNARYNSVDRGLFNGILSFVGFDFVTVNESILGRELRPQIIDEEMEIHQNAGEIRVNPFDRFGMAGQHWTSYFGEWKYYQVDACQREPEIINSDFGRFYRTRNEPLCTFSQTAQSTDPRVIQFDRGLALAWVTAFSDLFSNFLFNIAKFIVTLTIAFVGLAFSDISTMIGLTGVGGGAIPMFTSLYRSLFLPLSILFFVLTGAWIMYKGMIRGETREALVQGGAKTILCFALAIMISMNPNFWIPLPNTITTFVQSMVILAMVDGHQTDEGLCYTNVGSIEFNTDDLENATTVETITTELGRVSANMRSIIGCRIWEEFIFTSWVQGQFGTEFENLTPENLGNVNYDWVGSPSVGLGDGTYIENWALFQVSTQTNAHAGMDGRGIHNFPLLINGIPADWWRVVDAMSNYDIERTGRNVNLGDHGNTEIIVAVQIENEPTYYWNHWVGNRAHERFGVAFLAIIFGVLGSIGLLVFAAASAIFGVGVTLLMMISPIFFLFGTWAGKGQEIFLGWLALLFNTMIKRIIAAALLVLSFSFTMAAMEIANELGWIRAFILLAIITYILVKNKNRILDSFAKVDFGGFNAAGGFNKVADSAKSGTKKMALIGVATGAGARKARKLGMTRREGAKIGFKNQTLNTLRQSQFGQRVAMTYEQEERRNNNESVVCMMCKTTLQASAVGMQDEYGNYYCQKCGDETGRDDLFEFVVSSDFVEPEDDMYEDEENEENESNKDKSEKPKTEKPKTEQERLGKDKKSNVIKNSQKGHVRSKRFEDYHEGIEYIDPEDGETKKHPGAWISFDETAKKMEVETNKKGVSSWNENQVAEMIKTNLTGLDAVMKQFDEDRIKFGKDVRPPSLPEVLQDYVPSVAQMGEAWSNRDYDYINDTYRNAWAAWYTDNANAYENYSVTKNVSDLTNRRVSQIQNGHRAISVDALLETSQNIPSKDVEKKMKQNVVNGFKNTIDGKPEMVKFDKVELNKTNEEIKELEQNNRNNVENHMHRKALDDVIEEKIANGEIKLNSDSEFGIDSGDDL